MLTWFSHNISNTKQVSRIFDMCLFGHPLLSVYLSAAMVVHMRTQILACPCTCTIYSTPSEALTLTLSWYGELWRYVGVVSDVRLKMLTGDFAEVYSTLQKLPQALTLTLILHCSSWYENEYQQQLSVASGLRRVLSAWAADHRHRTPNCCFTRALQQISTQCKLHSSSRNLT